MENRWIDRRLQLGSTMQLGARPAPRCMMTTVALRASPETATSCAPPHTSATTSHFPG